MAEDRNYQTIDALLTDTLRKKEMEVERRINILRGLIGTIFIPIIIFQTAWVGAIGDSYPFFIGLVLVLIFYTLAIHRFSSGEIYRPLLKYFSITFDFILVMFMFLVYVETGIAPMFFQPQGQAAAILMVFFMLIALSALRHSQWAISYAGALSVSCGLWLSLIIAQSPLLAAHGTVVLGFTTALVVLFSRDFRDTFIRLHQRESLTRFLPKELVESIDRGDISLALGGEEKQVTLLLSDIRGFTSLSEKMPPSDLVDLLNEYLGRMTEVVFQYGGTLDKFMGDAILAVFGSPVSHGDDPIRAITTALKMEESLATLNEELAERGVSPLRIGIALHTGMVVAGNIGAPQRMDFTVIGDSVNLVSRIEGLNKVYDTNILMSEETYKLVDEVFEGVLVAETSVRGREGEVRIYGVKP